MSIESAAWHTIYTTMTAQAEKRPFSKVTLRRIARFARPHRRRLTGFVVVSIATAVVTVATPLLAGRVIDAIVASKPAGTVVGLALIIAAIALAEAVFSLIQRWLSASIGEGLILDLRTALYDHVQRMPIAFFNRTRTGALVSRLNNDVMGAQRAFSNTAVGCRQQCRDLDDRPAGHAHTFVASHRAGGAATARLHCSRTPAGIPLGRTAS